MDSKIKLTCVTAVYNAVKSGNKGNLIRCIESVSKISIPHEHLVYDGGSEDGSCELLHMLEKKIQTLKVVSEKDSGIYNALNKGVRDANGEWFFVLGCDDYIFNPCEISNAVNFGDCAHVDIVGSLSSRGNPSDVLSWWHAKRLFCGSPFSHQGILMKTTVIRDLKGFDERYKIAADFDLMQKAFLDGYKLGEYRKPYCCTGEKGISSNIEAAVSDRIQILIDRFNVTKTEASVACNQGLMPFRIIKKYLVSRSPSLRCAAYYQLCKLICSRLGL